MKQTNQEMVLILVATFFIMLLLFGLFIFLA